MSFPHPVWSSEVFACSYKTEDWVAVQEMEQVSQETKPMARQELWGADPGALCARHERAANNLCKFPASGAPVVDWRAAYVGPPPSEPAVSEHLSPQIDTSTPRGKCIDAWPRGARSWKLQQQGFSVDCFGLSVRCLCNKRPCHPSLTCHLLFFWRRPGTPLFAE